MHPAERFMIYAALGASLALFLWRFHLGSADIFLPVHTPGGVDPDDVPTPPDTSTVPPNDFVGLSAGFDDAGTPGPAAYTATSHVARPGMPPPPSVTQ